ncbi:RPAP1-like protein [Elsinoe ampelina]|uniref:RPAP1-like protein n=1 Tax=Elsinoe ampelina TaxID=302913 RepID=A0A6A6G332_9PEZI|nr:RPAP1-like protein [Elsinoe ampelina]
MAIRGQKVHIDLDDGGPTIRDIDEAPSGFNFVGDVQERTVSPAAPPKPPASRASENGFPAHKKRLGQSRFKSARSGGDQAKANASSPSQHVAPSTRVPPEAAVKAADDEKRQIDLENRLKLDSMSESEIQEERQELLDSINPALLQALLRRAEYKPGGDDADFPGLEIANDEAIVSKKTKGSPKKVAFSQDIHDEERPLGAEPELKDVAGAEDSVEQTGGEQTDNLTTAPSSLPVDSIHFPRPKQPPELDPSSASFLEDLHQKYFPSLPADPDKLEWMRPATGPSSYSPSQTGLDPKDIRFSFSGALIPPSTAAEIPVTAGLHHHGEAPDAAGYTIPELARLARSTLPSQRCIAYQTLGRILYRLGSGEFGNPSEGKEGTVGAEDTIAELARGLWREVEREQIIEMCTAETEGKNGKHVSAQAYATEAIWLWQKGGGRRFKSD